MKENAGQDINRRLKALVIGGSGNLGSEVCRMLCVKGFEVAFTFHRNREKADTLTAELREQGFTVHAFQLDLADAEQIRTVIPNAAHTLQGIDSMIVASGTAVGCMTDRQYFEITPDAYDRLLRVNVRGVFFACQETARIMSEAGGGRIVITGSIDGVKPVPAPADYASCKGALWGMTQSLAKELGKYRILVNMIAPGILEGGIAGLLSRELADEYLKHCSLRRVGTFAEAAGVIAFLAGHKNTYITGQAVILDGGL